MISWTYLIFNQNKFPFILQNQIAEMHLKISLRLSQDPQENSRRPSQYEMRSLNHIFECLVREPLIQPKVGKWTLFVGSKMSSIFINKSLFISSSMIWLPSSIRNPSSGPSPSVDECLMITLKKKMCHHQLSCPLYASCIINDPLKYCTLGELDNSFFFSSKPRNPVQHISKNQWIVAYSNSRSFKYTCSKTSPIADFIH